MIPPKSVTQQLSRLRSEDPRIRDEAAAFIWGRYCQVLLDLVCQKLNRRLQRRIGAEDIVQRAFKSFFFRQQRGDYRLADRDDLLRLLVRMALNKTRGMAVREGRQRRDYRRDQTTMGTDASSGEGDGWLLEQLVERAPMPDEAAALADEVERRLAQLPEDLRHIALLKLEGYTNAEIAVLPARRCSVRTVERKLRLIREAWGAGD
jgi:RNA polymerase sigma-70 factor (ECF subfamily)